jgi:hypothetical protein
MIREFKELPARALPQLQGRARLMQDTLVALEASLRHFAIVGKPFLTALDPLIIELTSQRLSSGVLSFDMI